MIKWLMLLIGGYGTAVGIRASRSTEKDFVDVLTSDRNAIKSVIQRGKDKVSEVAGSVKDKFQKNDDETSVAPANDKEAEDEHPSE